MTNLLELLEEAQSQINTYKHPDTEEVSKRLDEILKAGKLGAINNDRLNYIRISNDTLSIATEYWVRGCQSGNDYEIPMSIINADDPIAAVKVWAKSKKVSNAQWELDDAKRIVEHRKQDLIDAENEVY